MIHSGATTIHSAMKISEFGKITWVAYIASYGLTALLFLSQNDRIDYSLMPDGPLGLSLASMRTLTEKALSDI